MKWRVSPGLPRLFAVARPQISIALMAAAILSVSGCSNRPETPAADASGPAYHSNDPLEPVNRAVWKFDMKLDKWIMRPVAKTYRDNTPNFVRTGVTNVLHNIKSPLIFVNDVLELNFPHAAQTFSRFAINSVIGVGGFVDVAAQHGVPYHDADFGETLGVWGIGAGPYLVLPILGPSSPRELAGMGVDSIVDPFGYEMREAGVSFQVGVGTTGATVINDRAKTIDDLDDLQRNSLDFYAAVRSLYQQKRAADVAEGRERSLLKQSGSAAAAPDSQEIENDEFSEPTPVSTGVGSPTGGAAGSAIPLVENRSGSGGAGRAAANRYSEGAIRY